MQLNVNWKSFSFNVHIHANIHTWVDMIWIYDICNTLYCILSSVGYSKKQDKTLNNSSVLALISAIDGLWLSSYFHSFLYPSTIEIVRKLRNFFVRMYVTGIRVMSDHIKYICLFLFRQVRSSVYQSVTTFRSQLL